MGNQTKRGPETDQKNAAILTQLKPRPGPEEPEASEEPEKNLEEPESEPLNLWTLNPNPNLTRDLNAMHAARPFLVPLELLFSGAP